MDDESRDRLQASLHRRALQLARLTDPQTGAADALGAVALLAEHVLITAVALCGRQLLDVFLERIVGNLSEYSGLCRFCREHLLNEDRGMCDPCWQHMQAIDDEIEESLNG